MVEYFLDYFKTRPRLSCFGLWPSGGIYRDSNDAHGANPLDLVRFGLLRFPEYFSGSVKRAAQLDMDRVARIFEEMPAERMSVKARQFAFEFVRLSVTELKKALA